MAIKGVKVDGTTYHFDYEYLENKPIELPDVSAADEGKILQVNSIGAWEAATISVGSSELCDTLRFYSGYTSNISSLSDMESVASTVTMSPAKTSGASNIYDLIAYLYGSSGATNWQVVDIQMPSIESFTITNACRHLKRLIIPNATSLEASYQYSYRPEELVYADIGSCSAIPSDAFKGCTTLSYVDVHSCSIVRRSAFAYCYSLASISLPNVQTIGSGAFYDCRALTSISLPQVQTIEDSAFYSCSSLASISLPNVQTIGDSAFYSCSSLTSVSLPQATSIGSYAFVYCSSLTSVSLPNVQTIGDSAFYSCSSLTSVSLPQAQTIGGNAFAYCYSLVSLNVPSLSDIEAYYGFSTCSSLTVVNAPMCKNIASSAFSGAYSLQSVYASACTYVGEYAFYGCSSLAEVHLNANCNIYDYAFADCLMPDDHTLTIYMYGDSLGHIFESAFGDLGSGSSGGDSGDGGEECNDGGEECNNPSDGDFEGPIPGLSIFVPESLYELALENFPHIYYSNIFSMASSGV